MSSSSQPPHGGESPVDRALSLAMQGERDAAIRWAAAIVNQDPSMPTALCLLGRLLGQMGKPDIARDACTIAVARAIDFENLPLAVAAAEELGRCGGDRDAELDRIASAFAKGSPRFGPGMPPPPPLQQASAFQPLPPHSVGQVLLDQAKKSVAMAMWALEQQKEPPGLNELPLFSSIARDGLLELCAACKAVWVGSGATVIEQGSEGNEAYFVARGELEVRRLRGGETTVLGRLTNGEIFGEMALLARAPRSGSVVAARPAIVLEISRAALDEIADRHPDLAREIASHCRDRMIENLMRSAPALDSVPEADRPALIERFQTRIFERNDRLITQDDKPKGLFMIASGEVAVIRREPDATDPLVLSTLAPGDIVGEVATVLRRRAAADVIALHPTVTLFLPASDFMGLVHDHPSILKELYVLAVQRDEETNSILAEDASQAEDFVLV